MSRPPRPAQLSSTTLGFAIAVSQWAERAPIPGTASVVASTVYNAMRAGEPKLRLNRSFAYLRRKRPGIFKDLHDWLSRPEVNEHFMGMGQAPAWYRWMDAALLIDVGEKATRALGMDPPTGTREPPLTPADEAAVVAEYLHQILGVPSHKATQLALDAFLTPPHALDLRALERLRRKIRLPKDRIRQQYLAIKKKARLRDAFVNFLPANALKADVPVYPPSDAKAGSTGASKKRILVLDDHPDSAATLAELLKMLGYEARSVTDPGDALNAAKDFKPDLALFDLAMPLLDGFELARLFRRDVDLTAVHLVAFTAYDNPSYRQAARDAGFEALVRKPAGAEVLDAIIAQLV